MDGPKHAVPGAGYALALLLGINLFNYIDRQILSATLPKIRLDAGIFQPNENWVTTKLGALTTAFMVSYMVLSPLFGWLAGKMRRWWMVGIAVIAWSLATGGTGLAAGYLMLLFTRCFVGIGEAAYAPVAPAMLSDLYPVDHRGRILSWFYAAIPVGSALGFVIGGNIADTSLGWRGAFQIAVIPGLLLGIFCFFMREPPRLAVKKEGPSYWAVLRELRGNRSFVFCCAGMTASTFVLGGVAALMQLYIFEREAHLALDAAAVQKLNDLKLNNGERLIPAETMDKLRQEASPEVHSPLDLQRKLALKLSQGELENYWPFIQQESPTKDSISNAAIGTMFGAIIVVAGLVATLTGGWLGDRLRNRGMKGAYFHVAGWGTLAGFPFFVAILFVPFPLAWLFVFLAVFALFFNTGPANTILANVTRSKIRATAFAINILIIHALGDAISPLILGYIKDLASFQVSFVAASFLIPVAGLLWVCGARHLDADTARAEAASRQTSSEG